MQQGVMVWSKSRTRFQSRRNFAGYDAMQRSDAKPDGSDRLARAGSPSWHRRLLPRGTAKRPLALALQGGGSFGAFTWGVLDRLLEQDTVALDALSGTSAGAVNAVVLANGLAEGGPAEARARLKRVWERLSNAPSMA